jgi:hypothetical protein
VSRGSNRKQTLQELAKRMAALAQELPPSRPQLVVRTEPFRSEETIDGEWHCRMIRHLSKRWGLEVLVDQATRGYLGLESLPGDELARLHSELHRAYECLQDGITLEDAGFLKPQ